jgi:exosortase/archaeosortase family protein
LILVDAACSGVQLVWLAYFTACASALLAGCGKRHFFARLPLVGGLVLLGNVLRNAVLVAAQADGQPVAEWLHQGVGLVVLAVVCAITGWNMMNAPRIPLGEAALTEAGDEPQRFRQSPRFALWMTALFLPACALWHLSGAVPAANANVMATTDVEWPRHWEGRPLRPLALSTVEQRFAQGFPGNIVRLGNDSEVLVWRHVNHATRMLHPAADCYRAMGWRIRDEHLEARAGAKRWRCFTAELASENQTLRVCERIEDASGQGYTDTSAWYWAAITGQSAGPWQAMTVASVL